MIVFLLGLMDLISAVAFLGLHFNLFLGSIGIYIAVLAYLGLKAIIFRGDFASIIDGACSVFMLLMLLGLRTHFIWIVALYLGQKGFFSLKAMFE